MEITCKKCGETKPLDEFSRHKRCKFGRRSECKSCAYAHHKEWRAKNPSYDRKWRANWLTTLSAEEFDRVNKAQKKHAAPNMAARRKRLRAAVLEAYGARCACCGEDTEEFLSIDHIFND